MTTITLIILFAVCVYLAVKAERENGSAITVVFALAALIAAIWSVSL